MSNTYKFGNTVRVSVAFLDVDGAPTDPVSVVCKIKSADGTETAYTYGVDLAVVRDDVGAFHFWVATNASGEWPYRWIGIDGDGNEVANEDSFTIDESAFAAP